MENAVQHPEQTGMVLLIVGKRLRAPYRESHFMTSAINGYIKMAFAIGRAKPFCACMAHKRVDAGSQVSGRLRWVANMPIFLIMHVLYVQQSHRRLKGQPDLCRGPGSSFSQSREWLSHWSIWIPCRGL